MDHSDSDECQTADDTESDMRSVAVCPDGEVPSLGVWVRRSGVAHARRSASERARDIELSGKGWNGDGRMSC